MLKTKKGLLGVIACMVLSMLFSFALIGCENETAGKDGEVTQEQWNAALGAENLENVTITLSGIRITDEQNESETSVTTVKFADGKMQVTSAGDLWGEAYDEVFIGENVEENKKAYLNILTCLLEQREKFTFDDSDKTYKLDETVTTTVSFDDKSVVFTITMKNSRIRFDGAGKPIYFKCDYTQTSNDTGFGVFTVEVNATWEFSDYGTTAITKTVTQS